MEGELPAFPAAVATLLEAEMKLTGVSTCPGVATGVSTGRPVGPRGKLLGGMDVLMDVRGLLGATAVVGMPGTTVVSMSREVSRDTEGCAMPTLPCSLNRDRSFSSRVLMSSIPGALD